MRQGADCTSPSRMSKMVDLQVRLASLENDILLSRAQNGWIKTEMDKLRARNMVLEQERERAGRAKEEQMAAAMGTPSRSYAHLEETHRVLVAKHEALLAERQEDSVKWRAIKSALEESNRKLRRRLKKFARTEEQQLTVPEKRKVESDSVESSMNLDGAKRRKVETGKQSVEATQDGEEALYHALVKADVAASSSPLTPLSPTAKDDEPNEAARSTNFNVLQAIPLGLTASNVQDQRTVTPATNGLDPVDENESIGSIPGSGNEPQQESLHLLDSLPPLLAKAVKTTEPLFKPHSNVLAAETLERIPRALTNASPAAISPNRKAVSPQAKAPAPSPSRARSRQSMHDKPSSPGNSVRPPRSLAPRQTVVNAGAVHTPDLAPPRKVRQSEPAPNTRQTPQPAASTHKAHTEGRTRWLGKGGGGDGGGTSSSKRSATHSTVRKHDSFEDDGPPVFRVPAVPDLVVPARGGDVTPTASRRTEKGKVGPSRLGQVLAADSPFLDRLVGGMGGQVKQKQLRELASIRGKERVEVYKDYKGHGRYAGNSERTTRESSRERFEIDPARNGGVAHAYHESVRNKEHRRHLPGDDCEECRNYYNMIGELPDNDRSVPFRRVTGGAGERDEERIMQGHKDAVSRHRDIHPRAKTPPGYWNVGFPTTQEVNEQNAMAEQMVAEKAAKIKRDAERGVGAWRRRD